MYESYEQVPNVKEVRYNYYWFYSSIVKGSGVTIPVL